MTHDGQGATSPGSSAGSSPAPSGGAQAAAIDVEKLAEKVYQLMRQEARLARARGQLRPPRR
jgi:hypothetical protein